MSNDFSLDCPCCNHSLFDYNITHNLNDMARRAGVYDCLWHPNDTHESNKGKYPPIPRAELMIPTLEKGLAKLRADPEYFKHFNPSNGWGSYENLVDFVVSLLEACKKYPQSYPEASI